MASNNLVTPTVIPSISTEYVMVDVRASREGKVVNPTSKAVSFGFVPRGGGDGPYPSSWHEGTWEVAGSGPSARYIARCLIGPESDVPLTPQVYSVWVWVEGETERPRRPVGYLRVT